MVDQYLGEIKLVGFNFAPAGWAQCAGQIVSIQQFSALFALLGTMYGGNGTSNFGLPDLQGRAAGQVGPSLYTAQGQKLGTETVTLNLTQYPFHNHSFSVNTANAAAAAPLQNFLATTVPVSTPPAPNIYASAQGAPLQPLNSAGPNPVIGFTGGAALAHENMMPFLAMNYVIAMTGVFPPRG